MSFYDQISANRRTTLFLFVIFFFMLLALGIVISIIFDSFWFLLLFGIIAMAYIIASYYNSDKIITSISRAKPASEQKYKQLHNVVEEMSLAAGLPKPKVYIIEDTAINAFATGRDPRHAVICVTTGALEKLDKGELEGVIAHELSHIANYDIRFMTLVAVLV